MYRPGTGHMFGAMLKGPGPILLLCGSYWYQLAAAKLSRGLRSARPGAVCPREAAAEESAGLAAAAAVKLLLRAAGTRKFGSSCASWPEESPERNMLVTTATSTWAAPSSKVTCLFDSGSVLIKAKHAAKTSVLLQQHKQEQPLT